MEGTDARSTADSATEGATLGQVLGEVAIQPGSSWGGHTWHYTWTYSRRDAEVGANCWLGPGGTTLGSLAGSTVRLKNGATLELGATEGGPSSRGPPELVDGLTPGHDLGATSGLGAVDGDGGRPRRPATGAGPHSNRQSWRHLDEVGRSVSRAPDNKPEQREEREYLK
jgi:hypothetical protein